MPLRFTITELQDYLSEVFPQVKDDFVIEDLTDDLTQCG